MGYHIRFLQTDKAETTLALLEKALKQIDPVYSISIDAAGWYGNVFCRSVMYGEIEINTRDQDLFGEEIADLKDQLLRLQRSSRDLWKQWPSRWNRVQTILNQTKAIVCVRVLIGGHGSEAALAKIDPLWDWLLDNRQGLVYDDHGYYDRSGLILSTTYDESK